MTTTIKTNVNTRIYEATWGRAPRGRGFWLFSMKTPDGRVGQFSHSGSYTEARSAALTYAKREGVDAIELMS